MNDFRETTYLSEILEKSNLEPVIIFKHSSTCASSARIYDKLEKWAEEEKISMPIFIIIVQKYPALSEKIARLFDIRHESPQILILNKQKVIYTAHHDNIAIKDFIFQ